MSTETIQTPYAFRKTLEMSYDEAIVYVTEEMKKEGFGVLTSIDVRETLKKKIDVEFRPYTILGACNPKHAYHALSLETEIGLMLPCNFIVYVDDEGETVVSAIDPIASMQAVENPGLGETALEVREKIRRVIDSL